MRRPPRFNVATLVFVGALAVAVTILIILLRNPATHADLESEARYDRTPLAYLDQDYSYLGFGVGAAVDAGSDPHTVGRILYVRAGCAGCHGTVAQGGIVGDSLWSAEPEDIPRDLRDGPSGMPSYPEDLLSDEAIGLIVGFLAAAPADAAAIGVTTTTTTRPPPPTTAATTTTLAPTTTLAGDGATTTTTQPAGPEPLLVEAPVAAITVDGDPADWEGISGVEFTMGPIVGEEAPPRDGGVKVAHDDSFIYVLFTVVDDFEWSDIDPRLSGAPAVMWPIDQAAGPHMGGEDPSGYPALGMVDVWYWRLECPAGEEQGGAVHGPGSGDPGNDGTCNLDDEWSTEPEVLEDDVGDGAENSLLGVFSHSNPVPNGEGTWYFEFRRPLQTGDPRDAQFVVGETTRLALAYWDPDAGQNGWGRKDHVQTSDLGWINVVLLE